jgi:hypothetical protein
MKCVRVLLVGVLVMLLAGAAAAAEVSFQLVTSETFDAQFPSIMTWNPELPMVGTGDVDEAAGTYSLSLPDFTVTIDVFSDHAPDVDVTTTNWSQTGTFAGGVGGAISGSSATGTVVCVVHGGRGSAVCPDISPDVPTWPPTGATGTTLGAPSASIDIEANTITVVHGFDASGGQVQNSFIYGPPIPPPMVPAMGPLGASLLASLIVGTVLVLGRRSSRSTRVR